MTTPAHHPDALVAFLRARYDERERIALAAADYGAVWRAGSGKTAIYPSDESRRPGPIIIGPYGDLEEQHTDHIVENDPAWVLADLESKRRILDECERYAEDGCTSGADLALTILPLLALPFAGHPDYREEWRPA